MSTYTLYEYYISTTQLHSSFRDDYDNIEKDQLRSIVSIMEIKFKNNKLKIKNLHIQRRKVGKYSCYVRIHSKERKKEL